MAEKRGRDPEPAAPGRGGKGGRQERLAAALRENLRRRKQQARGRETGKREKPEPPGD